MTEAQMAGRQQRAANETFVIQRVEEGFRVYAAGEPRKRYIVSGPADSPQCSCPDFQYHRNDPDWACKHVLAVLNEFSDIELVDRYDAEERRAIQKESQPSNGRPTVQNGNGTQGLPQLLLKRSVSPDGRIDSLSVELSSPVAGLTSMDIQGRAEQMLKVQSGVVAQFLDGRRSSNGNSSHQGSNGHARPAAQQSFQASPGAGTQVARPAASEGMESAVPARLVDVAGMDGKWGRRLFINVAANGRTIKLFGRADQLVQHIRAAGYIEPESFGEGTLLDIPCAVVTKPSSDGRYTNVDRVLPADQLTSQAQPARRMG